MKNMKKFISMLLVFSIMLTIGIVPAFAENTVTVEPPQARLGESLESAFAEGENSLIVFVTGIGQSWSYLFDDKYAEDGAFETGDLHTFENYAPLIANDGYKANWNLFNNYFDEALSDKDTLTAIIRTVLRLLISPITRKNVIKDEDVNTIVRSMFRYNIVGEDGKCDKRVVTPRYVCPVSEYPYNEAGNYSEAKRRFYSSIPCEKIAKEKLGENFEDYIYCYNYCAFSYTYDNIGGLHDFVETIIADNKVGAKDVILVPMSMGASVVSAYLAKYPAAADNHVRRVVSIVGCWDGSEIIYDLITKSYADNSADLFYNGIIAEMIGEPWGYVVNLVVRLFPKKALRGFIDQAIGKIVDNIILATPSLAALVPSEDYEEVRELIKSDKVREQTDFYYNAQSTLKSRLAALDEQGIPVYFIAGYGLPYGAVTSDYTAFGFLNHAEKTNSDEIIDISSTAPGTSFVPYNQKFADKDGRILSPDESIDISTAYYKDRCWYFYGQKHELEYNNTAIALAIEIALGNITKVEDCDNPEEDSYYYPQFNGARNIKQLQNNYIPELEKYLAAGGTLNAEQADLYAEVQAMVASHVNDFEADNALIDQFRNMLVDLGLEAPASEASGIEKAFNNGAKSMSDFAYKLCGAKGFFDFFGPDC